MNLAYNIDLSLTPRGIPPTLYLSAYDRGAAVRLYLRSDGTQDLSSAAAYVQGTRRDGVSFMTGATVSTNYVSFTVTEAMTGGAGLGVAELVLLSGDKRIGSYNFTVFVEKSAMDEDVEYGEEDMTAIEQYAKYIAAKASGGTPVAVATAAEMTDTALVYLYTGSESGYQNGYWYYHNGAAWVAGGLYGGVADTTLSIEGMAADAAKTGQYVRYNRKGVNENASPVSVGKMTRYGAKNLLDINAIVLGEAYDANGVLKEEPSSSSSNVYDAHLIEPIPLEAGEKYFKSGYMPLFIFDENGNCVKTYARGAVSFTAEEGWSYCDVNLPADKNHVFYLSKGAAFAGANDYDAPAVLNASALLERGIMPRLTRDSFSRTGLSENTPYGGGTAPAGTSTVALCTYGFIRVKKGIAVYNGDPAVTFMKVLIYNDDFAYTGIIEDTFFDRGCIWVAPEDCYIRVTVRYQDSRSIVTNDTEPLLKNIVFHDTTRTPFSEKKVSILGDSISTFATATDRYGMPAANETWYTGSNENVLDVHETYWRQTFDYLGMELLVNNSWSGRCVSSKRDNDGKPGGYQDGQIAALAKDGVSPDVIIVRLGANDFNHEVGLGSYDGTGDFPSAVNTFREAYAVMMNKIMSAYPTADVYCCTMIIGENNAPVNTFPEKNNTTLMNTYNDVIRDMAKLFNAKLIDQWDCGITYHNRSVYLNPGKGTGTWVHPTYAGHHMMAKKTVRDMLANPCR